MSTIFSESTIVCYRTYVVKWTILMNTINQDQSQHHKESLCYTITYPVLSMTVLYATNNVTCASIGTYIDLLLEHHRIGRVRLLGSTNRSKNVVWLVVTTGQ